MNDGHRKIILILLVAALAAGWFVGWFWGGAMHDGIEARERLTGASAALRQEARRAGTVAPAELSTLLLSLEAEKQDAQLAYSPLAPWYTAFRLIGFSGKLFLNILNLLVIPLVVSSLVVGVAALGDIRHVGRTGFRTVVYYFVTTSVAVAIGIALVVIVAPGVGVEATGEVAARVVGKEEAGILDTLLKVFLNEEDKALGAFPNNIFSAMARMNVLGVIVFSLFFGAALTTIGEKARVVVAFFDGLNDTVLKMIHWVMYLLPVGVFGLVVERLAATGGGSAVWGELAGLGYYAGTVIGGLALHSVVVLPVILWIFTRRSPARYASGMVQALFTAFSTASSSATLPTTMECAEVNNKVSARSASFVLPIGATINMDGTALYEAVAVIFIAQAYGVEMSAAMLVIVFLTATLAAIGAAGIPEAGLVTMVIVLNATGLPLEGIALLLSIDWFLDRCRTTVNVWGDSVGAAVIDGLEARDPAARPA